MSSPSLPSRGGGEKDPEVWGCVVVGAGVMGSAAAYHLATRGVKTLLLDQFPLPHTRGSSHGKSRITRLAYDKPHYAAMMPDAYRQWEELGRRTGRTLFTQTGLLWVQAAGGAKLAASRATMTAQGVPFDEVPAAELARRFPQLRLPAGYAGLLDNSAGMLDADACCAALQEVFVSLGGVVRGGCQVKRIHPGAGTEATVLHTQHPRDPPLRARKVVLTPGPWAGDLLQGLDLTLPLKALPGLSSFWRDTSPGGVFSAAAGFPLLLDEVAAPEGGYRFFAVFPAAEYPGYVKIVTRGEPPPRYCHPDARDAGGGHGALVAMVTEYVRRHLPDIEPRPSIEEPCVYTMTPDKDFIIDVHPKYPNIIIGAGFSGHGFKLAPVVGQLLAELVEGHAVPSYPLAPYSLRRFTQQHPHAKL